MVCKERAEALVKTIPWAFWQLFIILLSLFASLTGYRWLFCSLWQFCLICIHTKLIIVCCGLGAVKKRETARSLYVCRVCLGSKNSKDVLFRSITIKLEKSVSTWQFPVNKVKVQNKLRSPLIVIGHVSTVDIIGLVRKLVGRIQKHRLL